MAPKSRLAGRCLWAALGLGGLALAACLAAAAGPLARYAHRGPRVLAAVRASYPDLCREWRDTLVVTPSVLSGYTSWNVDCRSGYWPATARLMTVNVLTCQAREPLPLELSWKRLSAALVGPGARLKVCP